MTSPAVTRPDAAEPRHPIAVVAERTGLSQDVLRVWERRYGVVQPERGEGGQRRYSDDDVERLRLLHEATRGGRAIGQVAALPTAELAALVAEDRAARASGPAEAAEGGVAGTAAASRGAALVERSVALARMLDASELDDALRRGAAGMGLSTFLESVAAPLLHRVGDEWHAGRLTPAHEHLVSGVLHDIVTEAMRALTPPPGAPRVLVATPAGDRHVIGAALVGAAAAVEGWRVLYLGADLPARDIAQAARDTAVAAVALSAVYLDDRARVLGELREIRALLPAAVPLIAGGSAAGALAAELAAEGVRVETSLAGLVSELARLRPDQSER